MNHHAPPRMLHSIPTPLKPNEVLEDELEASQRVRFESTSDAILARLSLREHVPPDIMDMVISAIRDPLFDRKELVSKSSADIYVQTAKSRMQDTTLLDARSGYHPTFVPQDVLANIIDILKDKALSAFSKLAVAECQLKGELWTQLCTEEKASMHIALTTLAACSLVHTSWHIISRRALGTILLLRPESALHDALRNPCFGDWTTEMCLQLQDGHHPQHILPFFSRLPNIKFMKLGVSGLQVRSGANTRDLAVALCEALSSLHHLQEYEISGTNSHNWTTIDLRNFTRITSRSLEVIRFVGLPVRQYLRVQHFAHLHSVLSLRRIHIHSTDVEGSLRMPFTEVPMSSISWTRPSSSEAFTLNTVGMYAPHRERGPLELDDFAVQLSTAEQAAFSGCKTLVVDTKHGCDLVIFINVFNTSVSANTLHIKLEALGHLLQFGFVIDMCSSLAELQITFPYSSGPRDFAAADEHMFQLMSNASQKVKTLKAHFFCKRGYSYNESFIKFLLPNCHELCSSRRIAFEISMNDFSELNT
ncbi:hypothetical protein SCHPADRAFT_992166 [Schizopora paradoxa]|uniref:Uncharacterized protein n=1 Tax=Schizopora paradoxa TaxID=27342 RepID=A0A0H2SEA7_9AGAM|nr:hypothetical protein SCHPADRAFT_992166 [Schizopora paradoxa]